jgi:superkiller protein 3
VAREEWESALAAYGRAAELLPDDPEPLYRRGHLLVHTLGRPVEAIDDFRQALDRDPDYAPARRELGAIYLEAGSCDAAARTLLPQLASERDAGAAATYARLGTCFLDGGQGEEALLYLEEAVRLSPTSVPYRLSLARTLVETERYVEAIAAYHEVLELEPENAEAREALDALGGSEP